MISVSTTQRKVLRYVEKHGPLAPWPLECSRIPGLTPKEIRIAIQQLVESGQLRITRTLKLECT